MARTATAEEIEARVLDLEAKRGADKTICPSEAARSLGGDDPENWVFLMRPVRSIAIRLMKEA